MVTSEKKYGNKILFYLIKGPKSSQLTIRKLYKVTRFENSNPRGEALTNGPKNYLKPNRFVFLHGRDLTLEPTQKEGLNYFIYPYVEVDGKVFDSVKAEFYFEDLPEEPTLENKTGGI